MTTITASKRSSSIIVTDDGTELYYKDWGEGPPVTFSHGWPLNSDIWDGQMLFLAQNGFRAIAHDRRGHGRSSQASSGNDMNGYADDLAAVIEALDLNDVTAGGPLHRRRRGRALHRPSRDVSGRQGGPDRRRAPGHDADRYQPGRPADRGRSTACSPASWQDRSQFYKDLALQFYGANRPGAEVSQGILDEFWSWSMQSGLKNSYESIKAFSETDFTEDLEKFDVPTLVIHGEDDQIVPVANSAMKSARLIKDAKDIYYPGAPHGITATHQDQVNAELLAFLQS